jgi:hypothetical protein
MGWKIIKSNRSNKYSEIKQIETEWNKPCRKGFVNVTIIEIKWNKAHVKILLSEKRWSAHQIMVKLKVDKLSINNISMYRNNEIELTIMGVNLLCLK